MMKSLKYYIGLVALGTAVACNPLNVEKIDDPNNPSVFSVSKNASKAQIQYLITGLESRHRDYVSNVTNGWGSIGREVWFLNSSDTRNMSEWLGFGGYQLNASVFGFGNTGGGSYASPYGAIKQAQILLDAVENTSLLTDAEKSGVIGFAKTIAAYQFLIPANWLYENGIRIDVKDELNPGPFVPYQDALKHIQKLADEGHAALTQSGSTVFFKLSSGFGGYNTVEGLAKLNRAVAARVAIYSKDWPAAKAALNGSFMNLTGDLEAGPKHTYSGGTDANNPLYSAWNVPNPGSLRVVSPSTLRDTTAGDLRVRNKFLKLNSPFTVATTHVTLTGEYQDKRFASNTMPLTFLKNEELILIKAEVEAQTDNPGAAVDAINIIREAAGIGKYTGPTDKNSLLKEVLYQRRYSLWAEPWGHRWIDVRRYTGAGLLFSDMAEQIDVSFDKGAVYKQFPLPQAEVNWELYKKGK